jgi:hypothetical protein
MAEKLEDMRGVLRDGPMDRHDDPRIDDRRVTAIGEMDDNVGEIPEGITRLAGRNGQGKGINEAIVLQKEGERWVCSLRDNGGIKHR